MTDNELTVPPPPPAQIKENRRGGGVSAGPQSHILEGVSWDEARQLQEAAEQRAGSDQVGGARCRLVLEVGIGETGDGRWGGGLVYWGRSDDRMMVL